MQTILDGEEVRIRISSSRSLTQEEAHGLGIGPCLDRMIAFTQHLRRLRVDQYEYAALKLIILLTAGERAPLSCICRKSFIIKGIRGT